MIITLGMPIVGDLPGDTLESHLRMAVRLGREAERSGHQVLVACPKDVLPHDRARMEVFDVAKEYKSDLVFFVDADTVVPKGGFEELLKLMQDSKAPFVTGHYYRRGDFFTCVWGKYINGEFFQVEAGEGIHEIDTCGLGCALIDLKWVLKNVKAPYFTMEMDEKSIRVTDDISFCKRVRAAGGKILGHAGVRCIHLGPRMPVCDEFVKELRRLYHNKGGFNARSQSNGEAAVPSGDGLVQSPG